MIWRILAVLMDVAERYRCEYTKEQNRITVVCRDKVSNELTASVEIDIRDPILLRVIDSILRA